MPQYKSLVRPLSPKAMNIAYVEYDFGADNGMGPWSAVEDKDGMFWIPYYGRGNAVVRLDPKTAELTQFPLPLPKMAATGIHSAVPAPDGTVWFTELATGRIGHLNPLTREITEYQNSPLPDGKRTTAHTIRMDDRRTGVGQRRSGHLHVRSQIRAVHAFRSRRDLRQRGRPKRRPVVHLLRAGRSDRQGHQGRRAVQILSADQGQAAAPEVDSDGIVWFTERRGGKIGRLDPTTGTFKEFPLPGPEPSPYAIGIDRNHMIWYSSHEQDTLDRLDPRTGEVTEYPYPHSEISMREFFLDSQGPHVVRELGQQQGRLLLFQ